MSPGVKAPANTLVPIANVANTATRPNILFIFLTLVTQLFRLLNFYSRTLSQFIVLFPSHVWLMDMLRFRNMMACPEKPGSITIAVCVQKEPPVIRYAGVPVPVLIVTHIPPDGAKGSGATTRIARPAELDQGDPFHMSITENKVRPP